MSFPWRILWHEKRVGECMNKTKYFYVHVFNISNSHAVTKFLFPLTVFTKHTILDVWLVLATPLVLLTIFVTLTIIIILIKLNIGSHFSPCNPSTLSSEFLVFLISELVKYDRFRCRTISKREHPWGQAYCQHKKYFNSVLTVIHIQRCM